MSETQLQVKVKVVLPEMVCQNCKRFYIAYHDGLGHCTINFGEVVSRDETCDRFSPVKVEAENE